jgi:hypothetical protein
MAWNSSNRAKRLPPPELALVDQVSLATTTARKPSRRSIPRRATASSPVARAARHRRRRARRPRQRPAEPTQPNAAVSRSISRRNAPHALPRGELLGSG